MTEGPERIDQLLREHSAEGISILSAEPSHLIYGLLYSLGALLLAILVWAFWGRTDEIITAAGDLQPEQSIRRVYTPIAGELVDIYIDEGMPVTLGDVLARVNARDAIQAAAEALDAQMRFATAEREYSQFPAQKQLLERKVEVMQKRLQLLEQRYQKSREESLAQLNERHRFRVEQAQAKRESARQTLATVQNEYERYRRLFESPGGGGIARNQVEDKKRALVAAQADSHLAETEFGELELVLNQERTELEQQLQGDFQELLDLRVQYAQEQEKVKVTEQQAELTYRAARLRAEAASRISFENIDEDDYLLIKAPLSGIVTSVAFNQIGDKVPSDQPIAGIAPEGAKPQLKIRIPEQSRALLREGLAVKMKFNAFPYQRYGYVPGRLDYIAPVTSQGQSEQVPAYEGRVSLERDYFEVDGRRHALRYGMSAQAEMVVRQRRLIDVALDSLRGASG